MTVVFAALAAVWGWFVLNQDGAPRLISWITNGLRRLPKGEKLVSCPWCIGAWLAIVGVVWQEGLTWDTPVHALAAAGLTGILGSTVSMIFDDGYSDEYE